MEDDPEQSIVVSDDLREAAGVVDMPPPPKREPDPEDHPKPHRSRRAMVLWTSAIVTALVIGIVVFIGQLNTGRYLIACEQDEIIAEQGRSFPPWGARQITGAEWKPIPIGPNAECKPRETDNVDELAGWYLDQLVDQASTSLSAREGPQAKIDQIQQQLDQALLLARAPERRDQRKDIERLLGDVDYWRAAAKLHDAQTALADAAKQFDQAATKRPRHVSDASAWGEFVKRVGDELKGGPGAPSANAGMTPAPVSPGESIARPPAPPGIALPVEPPPATEAPAATPDAGVPGGGVLL